MDCQAGEIILQYCSYKTVYVPDCFGRLVACFAVDKFLNTFLCDVFKRDMVKLSQIDALCAFVFP